MGRQLGRGKELTGAFETWPEAAAHMGSAYLRYAHTRSTNREAQLLVNLLELRPGAVVADVGCGPGRHVHALREAGVQAIGLDVAATFARLTGAPTAVADGHVLPLRTASCDAAFSIQMGEVDELVVTELARIVRPGSPVVLTAFSAHYAQRYLGLAQDADRNVERTSIVDEWGREADFVLTYRCVTPVALRALAHEAGLEVEDVWSVEPGHYGPHDVSDDLPELLLVGRKPAL